MNLQISPHMIFFLPHSGVIFESQFFIYKNLKMKRLKYVGNGIKPTFKA